MVTQRDDGPLLTAQEWADRHTGGMIPSQIVAAWAADPNGRAAGITPMAWINARMAATRKTDGTARQTPQSTDTLPDPW